MMKRTVMAFGLVWALTPQPALPHCDTLDGPVVLDAKAALHKGDVTPVLKWVRADDEGEIRRALAKALKVRGLGDDARDLADHHFFETLVRIHRAGEGVAYTGLKPAGTVDPGIAAADKALVQGSADQLATELGDHVAAGLRERFSRVVTAKSDRDESVDAGRAYVTAYVEYVHYVEAAHTLATAPASEHHPIHTVDR